MQIPQSNVIRIVLSFENIEEIIVYMTFSDDKRYMLLAADSTCDDVYY